MQQLQFPRSFQTNQGDSNMIPQVWLYNELVKQLTENAIYPGELEGFSNLIEEKGEEGGSILNRLNSSRELLDKISKIMGKMAENIDPIIAAGIYERVNILQENVELFEGKILSRLTGSNNDMPSDSFHGLRSGSKDRINVFLVGKFSAGKTSFVRRLTAGLSGYVAGNPSTACVVVHKNESQPSLTITFNKEFSINNREKFIPVLKEYDLFTPYFTVKDNSFILKNRKEITFDNWGDARILSFLKDANEFPEAFDKVIWNHGKSAEKKDTLLDFANLYDMPGFGGKINHDPVIENILKREKPDIILYLLDTDSGLPSDVEVKSLSKLLQSVTQHDLQPLFCWVYQKSSTNSAFAIELIDVNNEGFFFDEKFMKGKKESLAKWIDEIVDAEKFIKEKTSEITDDEEELKSQIASAERYVGLFNWNQVAYLRKSFILDARGPREDTEIARNAVSLVLQKYFDVIGEKYYEEAKTILDSRSKKALEVSQQEVMQYKPNVDSKNASENSFIKEKILDKIRDAHDDHSLDNARKIFSDALGIELSKKAAKKTGGIFGSSPKDLSNDNDDGNDGDLAGYPFDLKATLKKMKENIGAKVDEMLDSIKIDSEKVSLDALVYRFWNKYQNDTSWQRLLFNVQAYHWLKASYEGLIAPQYISDIGFVILDNIKKDIDRIIKTENSLHMITSLLDDDF